MQSLSIEKKDVGFRIQIRLIEVEPHRERMVQRAKLRVTDTTYYFSLRYYHSIMQFNCTSLIHYHLFFGRWSYNWLRCVAISRFLSFPSIYSSNAVRRSPISAYLSVLESKLRRVSKRRFQSSLCQ